MRSSSSSSVTGASTFRACLIYSPDARLRRRHLRLRRRELARQLGQQLRLGNSMARAQADALLQRLPGDARQAEEGLDHTLALDGGGEIHLLLAAGGDLFDLRVGAHLGQVALVELDD